MNITDDIVWVGVNDHQIDLFEGQYIVPNGMSYNSYVVLDDEITIFDTVDGEFAEEWLQKIEKVIGDRKPEYLVIQHMEPDHSANINKFMDKYPQAKLVTNSKALQMIQQFFGQTWEGRQVLVKDGDTLCTGRHIYQFVFAPMVHWPEVMMTYDSYDHVLFSADAFGKFGAMDVEDDWVTEARRYYIGIVGKYGLPVQKVLKKAQTLDIQQICSLHGPILKEQLEKYIGLYSTWASYEPEEEGIVLAYDSIYGNTKKAVLELERLLKEGGCKNVVSYDLARCDISLVVAEAFRYSKLVLASPTYNADMFPFMKEFLNHLTERGFKKRIVGLIENGSWAPSAAKKMREALAGCEMIEFVETTVVIKSSMDETAKEQIKKMAEELL